MNLNLKLLLIYLYLFMYFFFLIIQQVLEARGLPIKDVSGSSDPYVKIYLLPDRKKKIPNKSSSEKFKSNI